MLEALSRDYQILLELHRRDPDHEDTWTLLSKTQAQLETAWLHHLVNYAGA